MPLPAEFELDKLDVFEEERGGGGVALAAADIYEVSVTLGHHRTQKR